ncbi:MAG: minor capsid protein, partial [Peptostreptococcaceae bacterium]|nr:minor capsid protein [Peptostreptococcaceae bacterium]
IEKELVKAYKEAMNNISKEISNLFYKYADDNNLSYKDAQKLLNGKEFKEFKHDLKTYMKLIEETGDEELLLELNTLSMKSRISRLEEMFYQCGKYINEVYENTNNRLQIAYSSTIKDNYYQTIYDIHKAIGVGASFSYIDNDMIKEILTFPWSGRHYSQRLWSNRTKLKNAMIEELTQMLIQGKGVKETSKALSKRLDADLKNCIRLIHTEHSYFMGESTAKAYEEMNVDKYQFLATLDNRTSEICQKLDGKVFDLKDRVVGVNASPMHPRCRSCEIPYIDNDYSTRFARDSKGKRIEVSSTMKYSEWAEIYKVK